MDAYFWVAPHLKNKSVLDLGCGRGDGMLLLSFYANKLTGIDNNSTSIGQAMRHDYFCETGFFNLDLNENLSDFLYTDPPAGHYDVVTAFETLEHLDNPKQVIEAIDWDMFYFAVPYNMPHPLHKHVFTTPEEVKEIIPKVSKMDLLYIKDEEYRVTLWK